MKFKLILGLIFFVSIIVVFFRYPSFAKEFLVIMAALFMIYIVIAFVVTKYQEGN
jgi:glucan phosphoethanolaminetransferase (alkaline phosphatase superfamily)